MVISVFRRLIHFRRKRSKWKKAASASVFLFFLLYMVAMLMSMAGITSRFDATLLRQQLSPTAVYGPYNNVTGWTEEMEWDENNRVNSSRWEEPWQHGNDKFILERVYLLNLHHEVINEARYGSISNNTKGEVKVNAVIVVQVHNRLNYLRYLVESLSKVRGIEQALLVFSHDLISLPINQLIRNITFARVIQLLYPYSIQFFPDRFPGQAPDDCPEYVKLGPAAAKKLGCRNWAYPGLRWRYRVAALCQLKHHHWWKLNYVFDGIVKRYSLEDRIVVLLEEDEIVAPDLLHVLELMGKKRAAVCPECQILSLGNVEDLLNKSTDLQLYRANTDQLSIRRCEYYRGMAINAAWWCQFRNACGEAFCTQDDYGLHWTLYQLSKKCQPLRELRIDSPRVIHVGECGMHLRGNNCAEYNSVALARRFFEEGHSGFFPCELHLTSVWNKSMRRGAILGGWGDPRDHQLCRLNTHPLEPITTLPVLPRKKG